MWQLSTTSSVSDSPATQTTSSITNTRKYVSGEVFSVISGELSKKIEALWLTEKDIRDTLQSADDIGDYLAIIDAYFDDLNGMKAAIFEKRRIEYQRDDMSQEDIQERGKRVFLTRLTYRKSLEILFQRSPWIGRKIGAMDRNFSDLMHTARDSILWETYQFDPDLFIQFCKINPGRWNDEYGNNWDICDQLYDTHEFLAEYIQKPWLFDDLVKILISIIEDGVDRQGTWTDARSIMKTLRELSNMPTDKIWVFSDHYDAIMSLAIASWRNASRLFFLLRSWYGDIYKKNLEMKS